MALFGRESSRPLRDKRYVLSFIRISNHNISRRKSRNTAHRKSHRVKRVALFFAEDVYTSSNAQNEPKTRNGRKFNSEPFSASALAVSFVLSLIEVDKCISWANFRFKERFWRFR